MWSSCGRIESESGKSTIERRKKNLSIRLKSFQLHTAAVASEATELNGSMVDICWFSFKYGCVLV